MERISINGLKAVKFKRTILFLAFILAFTVAQAQDKAIKLSGTSLTVQSAIAQIEKQTGMSVDYEQSMLNLQKKISVKDKNTNLSTLMQAVLKDTGLEYSIQGRHIILKKAAPAPQQFHKPVGRVKGLVVDVSGQPLIGVSIKVRNTNEATITDIDGKFEVAADKGDVLDCTYIGYANLAQKVTKSELRIEMGEDVNILKDVVVVGYGTQKRMNLTGAVSQVTEKTFESRPVQNVTQALQGAVPGMIMSYNENGGKLNNTASVSIRGAGTIGSGSTASPLVLIDGIEGNMNMLNPQDIESVSVLKDAAASSIYGSRAPFGVILITTKQGKSGKPVISYSANVRFNSPVTQFHTMDSYRFMHYYNDARVNGGQKAYFSQEQIDNVLGYQKGELGLIVPKAANNVWTNNWGNANTDWYDEFYKDNACSQDQSLSLSGGNDRLSYYVSGNFLNQEGILNHTDENYKRYTLNAKLNVKISNNVKLAYNTKWLRTDYDSPVALNQLIFHQIMRQWPNCPVRDPNGYYTKESSIIPLEDGGRNKEEIEQAYNQLDLTISPIKDWNIHLQGNMRTTTNFTHRDYQAIYAHDVDGNPVAIDIVSTTTAGQSRVYEYASKNTFYTTNIYSDYFRQMGGHYAKVMAGFNAELQKARTLSGQRDGIIVPELPTLNTSTSLDKTSGGYSHWSTAGFFGRINYNYKERYLLEVNGRYDGSSRFVRAKRWNFFPSFSVGWNMAREKFWEPYTSIVSQLKVRASWGELGNQNTSSLYPFYETLPVNMSAGGWLLNGKKPNVANAPSLVSSALTWERVRSTNIGLDFGMFSNRLTGSFDYFVRKTLDMVGPAPELPSILGTAVPKVNNADMQSKGWELELSWRDAVGDFKYGVKFNIYDAKQKILRYPNTTNAISTWYNGKEVGEIWGYTTIGIAKTQEEMDEHLASLPNGGQKRLGSKWGAGDIMYADINGDGKIDSGQNTLADHGDLRVIGNSTPRYNFGLVLDGSYKGFDISVMLQGVGKRDFAPEVGTNGCMFWGAVSNIWQSVALEDHWDYFRPEGHEMGANLNAYYPRPDFTSNKNHQVQTRYLQDASYIRLKNLQIGYSLPKSLISKMKLTRLRVYLSGDNLLTLTNLKNMYDPETLSSGSWGSGKTYPLSKVLSFGVNVNF